MVEKTGRTFALLLLLSLLWTWLNTLKPLTIDDSAYHYFAQQIADEPLDPYGCSILWYHHPQPANEILAPPVFLYWWGAGIRLFGDNPLLWKWWLFPFSALFVWSAHALLRRFAPSHAVMLSFGLVLSPAILPSLNLMLDIPAMALSMASLHCFFIACDRRGIGQSILAGLLAGLAMQTKYTGFLAPAVMFLYALLHGGMRQWLLASFLAVGLFAGWEAFIAWRYGASHFLFHLQRTPSDILMKLGLSPLLLSLVGSVTGGFFLIGLVALRAGKGILWLGMTVVGSIYLAIAFLFVLITIHSGMGDVLADNPVIYQERVTLATILFGALGALMWGVVGTCIWRLCRRGDVGLSWRERIWEHPTECFLLLWLLLEICGFFALTPFPAIRRILGLILIQMVIIGRVAGITLPEERGRRLLQLMMLPGFLLAAMYQAVDISDAKAQRDLVLKAKNWIDQKQSLEPKIWYVGHWGFQFYAERQGMLPVITDYSRERSDLLPEPSRIKKGDWLVKPGWRIDQQSVDLSPSLFEELREISINGPWPYRTVSCFYGGFSGLQHRQGAQLSVKIYRALQDHVPRRVLD